MNIDNSAIYYISIDSSRHALQSNEELLSIFLNELHFLKIKVAFGLASEVGEAFVLISTHFSSFSNQYPKTE